MIHQTAVSACQTIRRMIEVAAALRSRRTQPASRRAMRRATPSSCAMGTKEVIAPGGRLPPERRELTCGAPGSQRRGMRAPVLAIGDGALGFWAAVREVWPETAEQRCWSTGSPASWTSCRSAYRRAPRRRATRDAVCRDANVLRARDPSVHRGVQGQIRDGRRRAQYGPGAALNPLRLPSGALEAPVDHQPDRVHVRDGTVARARDEGRGARAPRAGRCLQSCSRWRRTTGGGRAGARFVDGVRIEREDERKKGIA
jgi:hypothetical protein